MFRCFTLCHNDKPAFSVLVLVTNTFLSTQTLRHRRFLLFGFPHLPGASSRPVNMKATTLTAHCWGLPGRRRKSDQIVQHIQRKDKTTMGKQLALDGGDREVSKVCCNLERLQMCCLSAGSNNLCYSWCLEQTEQVLQCDEMSSTIQLCQDYLVLFWCVHNSLKMQENM